MTAPHDEPINWSPVRDFLAGRVPGVPPIAGTAAWTDLDDADPLKLWALVVAGSRWCLEQEREQTYQAGWRAELDHLGLHHISVPEAHRIAALRDATDDLARTFDWDALARRIRDEREFYTAHPDLRRKAA